jgi:hypothetical protein
MEEELKVILKRVRQGYPDYALHRELEERMREDLFALASAAEHLLVENNRLRTEHKRLTAVLGVP